MSQADEHRQKVAECRQQAKLSITPLDKQHWLRLAEHWLKLAEAAERERRFRSPRLTAGIAAPGLPLSSDQRAEDKCGEKTDSRVEEIADSEGMQEGHGNSPSRQELRNTMEQNGPNCVPAVLPQRSCK